MGGFYHSFHVYDKTQKEVQNAIADEQMSFPACFIGPGEKNWVPVYPEINEEDLPLELLSQKLMTTILEIDLHDDDVFCYWLFRDGTEIDRFNSCPDYFGDSFSIPQGKDFFLMIEKSKSNQPDLFDAPHLPGGSKELEMMYNFTKALENSGFIVNQQEENGEKNKKTPQNHASILSYLLDNPDKEILLAKAIEKTQDIELMDAHRFGELLHLPEIYESYEYLTDQELPEGYLRVN